MNMDIETARKMHEELKLQIKAKKERTERNERIVAPILFVVWIGILIAMLIHGTQFASFVILAVMAALALRVLGTFIILS